MLISGRRWKEISLIANRSDEERPSVTSAGRRHDLELAR